MCGHGPAAEAAGGSPPALCRGRWSRACSPALRSGGGGAAGDPQGPGADAPEGRGTGGGAGGTRFAASGGSFGCTQRSFSLCREAEARLRRPGDWGSLWVAAPRSPLRARVLAAWAPRQRWTLLLWCRGGGRCPWDAPCTSGPRGPWLLPATGLPQFRRVLGVSSSCLPEIFPSL